MKPVWQDSHGALWQGHVLDVLAALPAQSVQCVVTSPPYWGLRAYGTDPQVWGGNDADCTHELESSGPDRPPRLHHGQGATTLHETGPHGTQPHGAQRTPKLDEQWSAWEASGPGKIITGGTGTASAKQVTNAGSQYGNAWAVVDEYHNHGDSSAGSKQKSNFGAVTDRGVVPYATCTRCGAWRGELGSEPTVTQYIANLVEVFAAVRRVLRDDGTCWINCGDSYQDKQLQGMPWRLAFALQEDGWYLRSAITLCKVAPMPESCTDRPTSATEMLFLLSKQERYFYDPDAVRQPHIAAHLQRQLAPNADRGDSKQFGKQGLHDYLHPMGANLKNWWEWRPEPSRGAHFASFPTHIPRRAILAGTSERGACSACGAPWRRVSSRSFQPQADVRDPAKLAKASNKGMDASNGWGETPRGTVTVETTGWAPTCTCDAGDPVPQIVLDPFVGSGTTVAVARALGRYGIGIDLNAEYIALARQRVQQGVLL